MIYNSTQIIPAKLFFHIMETKEYGLLADGELKEDELLVVWKLLEEEFNTLSPNKADNKVLNISKKIESLSAKYESIELALHYLKVIKDDDLIELLEHYNYKFTDDYKASLANIERESQAIQIKIKNEERRLPKSENKNNTTTFDEAVMSYCAFTGSGFIDPNKIKLSQYYALLNMGNNKMKSLEKNG